MTIRKRIEEAIDLGRAKGFEEASIILSLVAVAGASRKLFPKSTGKNDSSAFKEYLIERGATQTANYNGKTHNISDVLYHQYRCSFIHEAELPDSLRFNRIPGDMQFTIDADGTTLGLGWAGWLITAVREDPQLRGDFNTLFDSYHGQLTFKNDLEPWKIQIAAKYPVTPGRVDLLLNAYANIGIFRLKDLSDEEMIEFGNAIKKSPKSFGLNGGAITGMTSNGAPLEFPPQEEIFDRNGITETGVAFLKELLDGIQD
jgi:hypothetical protein